MAKGSLHDKKCRQDEILGSLKAKTIWTTKELSEHLSISHRTLMRDLAELKASGIPIDSDRGRGGGIRLDGRWGLGRLQLNYAETLALLLTLAIAETLKSPLLLDNLTSIKHRISMALPQGQRQNVEKLRARILIGGLASNGVLKTYQKPESAIKNVLSQCFFEMKIMDIEYQSEQQVTTQRTIEPQMFVLNWPVWYLLCWDRLRNDTRMLRLDRIKSAVKIDELFTLRRREHLLKGIEQYFSSL